MTRKDPLEGQGTRLVEARVEDVEPAGVALDGRLWMRLEDGELLTARMIPTTAVRPGDTVVGVLVPYDEGMPHELAILVTRILPAVRRAR